MMHGAGRWSQACMRISQQAAMPARPAASTRSSSAQGPRPPRRRTGTGSVGRPDLSKALLLLWPPHRDFNDEIYDYRKNSQVVKRRCTFISFSNVFAQVRKATNVATQYFAFQPSKFVLHTTWLLAFYRRLGIEARRKRADSGTRYGH
eukprot:329786-Pleurochrysis_carterae.AAC.2